MGLRHEGVKPFDPDPPSIARVWQFIDIGAGLPTVLNTHDVAQRADPGAAGLSVPAGGGQPE